MFGLFKKKLPDDIKLFSRFLAPWYPEGETPPMPRPDMYQLHIYEGQPLHPDDLQYLDKESLAKVSTHVNVIMPEAALEDYQHIIPGRELSLAVLEAVDRYYDRKRIAALIKESDPADFSNSYLVSVCEFGILLGELFKQQPGFAWLYAEPYFHSMIVHLESGFGIPVFDWAVKKFSEYGDDGFTAKFHVAIDGVNGKFPDKEE